MKVRDYRLENPKKKKKKNRESDSNFIQDGNFGKGTDWYVSFIPRVGTTSPTGLILLPLVSSPFQKRVVVFRETEK